MRATILWESERAEGGGGRTSGVWTYPPTPRHRDSPAEGVTNAPSRCADSRESARRVVAGGGVPACRRNVRRYPAVTLQRIRVHCADMP
eukprot:gene164-biopygen46